LYRADVSNNFFLLTPEDFNMYGMYPTPGAPEDLDEAMQPMDLDGQMMALLLDMMLDIQENMEDIFINNAVDSYFTQFLHALVQEKEALTPRHHQPDPREFGRQRKKGLND